MNQDLVSVAGLERIETVGALIIRMSTRLEELAPLGRLEQVEGELRIESNVALVSLHGLEQVDVVGELKITNNSLLASLDGLAGLERVQGDVEITGNDSLSNEDVRAFLEGIEVEGEVHVDF